MRITTLHFVSAKTVRGVGVRGWVRIVGIFLRQCLRKLDDRLKSFKERRRCARWKWLSYDQSEPITTDEFLHAKILFYSKTTFFSLFNFRSSAPICSSPTVFISVWHLRIFWPPLSFILYPPLRLDSLMAGVVYKRTPSYSFRLIRIFLSSFGVASLRRDINFVKV